MKIEELNKTKRFLEEIKRSHENAIANLNEDY